MGNLYLLLVGELGQGIFIEEVREMIIQIFFPERSDISSSHIAVGFATGSEDEASIIISACFNDILGSDTVGAPQLFPVIISVDSAKLASHVITNFCPGR